MGTSSPGSGLTPADAEALRKQAPCSHCGGWHTRACPRVKRMSFHPNRELAEVEFWAHGTWPDGDIIWPEDLPDDSDDSDAG